jgi:alkaline phosphatase D
MAKLGNGRGDKHAGDNQRRSRTAMDLNAQSTTARRRGIGVHPHVRRAAAYRAYYEHMLLEFNDPASPVVASEFVGTSITSQAWAQERLAQYLPDNPHILFADSRYRGYVRVDVTPKRWRADLRAMKSVQSRDAGCTTLATYVVEDGRPGPIKT